MNEAAVDPDVAKLRALNPTVIPEKSLEEDDNIANSLQKRINQGAITSISSLEKPVTSDVFSLSQTGTVLEAQL